MSSNNDEQYSLYKSVAGNKFSLRSSFLDQVRQIKIMQTLFKAGSEILYSTWAGIIGFLVVVFGIGGLTVYISLQGTDAPTVLKNLIPVIFVIIGFILIGFNILFTNPSMGNQFKVSLIFLINKFEKAKDSENIKYLREYRFCSDDKEKTVIEKRVKNKMGYKVMYLTAYQVRGHISQVSFDGELIHLAVLQDNYNQALEKDTQSTTINSIQKGSVEPKALPKNATAGMIAKRDKNYLVANSIPKNQQLKTIIVLCSPTYETLLARRESIENVFKRGLVISYFQLSGKEAKKGIRTVYSDTD